MNAMDWELSSCLRILRHENRRGLDDFELAEMDAWGSSMLAPFGTSFTHGWTFGTAKAWNQPRLIYAQVTMSLQ